MGSNGLTSARHDIFAYYLAEKYPESFDPSISGDLVYSGKLRLTDMIKELKIDAGKLVLSPPAPMRLSLRRFLNQCGKIFTVWYIGSGGGQTKNYALY